MLTFEVSINGTRRYLAGHPAQQSLHLMVWGGNRGAASVATSVAVPGEGPSGVATLSYDSLPLAVGDELTIRILDAAAADRPSKRNDGDGSVVIEAASK